MTARCPRCDQDVPLVVMELLFDPGHPFTVLARHTRTERTYRDGSFEEWEVRCEGSREEVVEEPHGAA